MNAQISLESIAEDAQAFRQAKALGVASGGRPIQGTSYTHEGMIDLLIANPWMSQNDLARHFGYTPSWISTIMSSDAFKVQYARRVETLVDPVLRANIEQNFKAMVLRSQEILMEKLNAKSADVPANLVLRTLDISARAAGYGARLEQAQPVNPASVEEHLETMSKGLTELLRRKRRDHSPIEGEIVP